MNIHVALTAPRTVVDSVLLAAEQSSSPEELAAVEFAPMSSPTWEPPTREEWIALANPYVVDLRLAWAVMQRTKADLMGMPEAVGGEQVAKLTEGFEATAEVLEVWLELLREARLRVLISAAAADMGARE